MGTINQIRKQISKPYETNYMDRVMRWFAPYMVKPLINTSITPNQVTAFMLLFGLIISPLLFQQEYVVFSILYLFYYYLDKVDGALAIIKKKTSFFGMYLDYLSHALVEPLIYFWLTWGIYFQTRDPVILLCGISLIFFYAFNRSMYGLTLGVTTKQGKKDMLAEDFYNKQPKFSEINVVQKIKLVVNNIYSAPYIALILVCALLSNVPHWFIFWYGTTIPFISMVYMYLYGERVLDGGK